MMATVTISKACEYCNLIFEARPYQVKIGNGRFCSHSCYMKSKKMSIPIEDRFWQKVDIREKSDCWEFCGFKNKDGYGIIGTVGNKSKGAHRVAYTLTKGEIGKCMVVMHKCDNPSCCNPDHLILGTQSDNIHDMVSKRRMVNKKGEDHGLAKLTKDQVYFIRSSYTGARGQKITFSKMFNVAPTTITNVLNGKNWV